VVGNQLVLPTGDEFCDFLPADYRVTLLDDYWGLPSCPTAHRAKTALRLAICQNAPDSDEPYHSKIKGF